jgi:hypothetical protein
LPEAGTHRTPLHNSWNANCDAIVRDVHYYDGVGADEDIVTNSNWSKYFRTRANIDVASNNRRSFVLNVTKANNDPTANTAIVSKLGVPADYDAAKMIDHEVVRPALPGNSIPVVTCVILKST